MNIITTHEDANLSHRGMFGDVNVPAFNVPTELFVTHIASSLRITLADSGAQGVTKEELVDIIRTEAQDIDGGGDLDMYFLDINDHSLITDIEMGDSGISSTVIPNPDT